MKKKNNDNIKVINAQFYAIKRNVDNMLKQPSLDIEHKRHRHNDLGL